MVIKGQKINDRYEVLQTIGDGGMANVFLAKDPILERNVLFSFYDQYMVDNTYPYQKNFASLKYLFHERMYQNCIFRGNFPYRFFRYRQTVFFHLRCEAWYC